jgi:ornithine carbamoyltransferase
MNKLKGRDFLTLLDYSREDLEAILNLAFDLKRKLASGERHHLLEDKNLGMLFCSPSTRTRTSFETGMSQLGGHAQYFGIETIQSHLAENWVDTAQVFSRYLDGLVVRLARLPAPLPALKYGECRQILELMADNASIPLVNAMDDEEHPCQTMADIMTIMEKFGPDFKKKKIAVPWVQYKHWVSPGMAHSTALAGATLGMHLTYAYPPGFDLDPKYMDEAKRRSEQSGATIEITSSLNEACEDADVILATYWGSVPNKDEDARLREPLTDWYISKKHFDMANKNAIFMNCMPLQRGIQATAEVVDGPMSAIYDEAENRLHTEKAILSLIMG